MPSSGPPPGSGISPAQWELIIELPKGCHKYDPRIGTSYGYVPSLDAGITFDVLFGLALVAHLVQTARFRRWTSVLLAVGALTEAIGWAGRTWSAKCPYNRDAFLMQITTLIIAPTFFTAALYIILGSMINILGRKSSLIPAKVYAIVFLTCDVISLVVQAVGGALASKASGEINGNTKPGTNIMVAGIAFQMASMTLFSGLVVDFLRRCKKFGGMAANYRKVIAAMTISFVMIYVRGIYRLIELAQGWTGFLITHEGYFIGLDAAIMVVAVCIFLVYDPASLIPRKKDAEEIKLDRLGTAHSPQ